MYSIDSKYRVPIEEISCPGCGRRKISQECSSCVKEFKYKEYNLVSSKEFIENILGIKPFC
jgi:4-hydroxy-3-methylbut-2-en-1-yl diphosphate synthase IspG/GcpE